MITPRRTRLLDAPDLPAFRRVLADCLDWDGPWDLRSSVVIVPSRAAADQLRWTLEQRLLEERTAFAPPCVATRDGLYAELHRRLGGAPPRLGGIERLVCGRAAAEEARASGVEPPFKLRPGLVDRFLGLYDELRRHRRDVDAFERLLTEALEPSRDLDRGARRMLRQTRFLAGMFRAYERRAAASGRVDEHGVRALALARGLRRPLRHVVVTVGDRACGEDGLWPADFDLLARLPGLARLDVVTTSSLLAAGYRERIEDLLPGIEHAPVPAESGGAVRLAVPEAAPGPRYFTCRDREEELLAVVRRVKRGPAGERTAVVFQRPLPYLYPARHVFASAGVPWETSDALPLASEPFAAALDLVLSFASSGWARRPAVELLRSPHFRFADEGGALDPRAVAALDRELREARYTGVGAGDGRAGRNEGAADAREARYTGVGGGDGQAGKDKGAADGREVRYTGVGVGDGRAGRNEGAADGREARYTGAGAGAGDGNGNENGAANPFARFAERWDGPDRGGRRALAARAARLAAAAVDDLAALTRPGSASALVDGLLRFVDRHRPPAPDDADAASREQRARAAVLGILRDWRDAHVRHDDPVVDLAAIASTLRRLLEAATFAAPAGGEGVVLVDVQAARYGTFDNLCLVGLVDREWPDPARQSALYPAALLYQLGWPRERDRLRAARAAFRDLLGSAARRVSVSTVAFEDDAVVAGSALLEDLADLAVEVSVEPPSAGRVTVDAGLAEVAAATPLADEPAAWLALRERCRAQADARAGGGAGPRAPAAYAVGAVETWLSCPFKYFASTVLRLDEEADDEVVLSPRSRGRFVHEVFRAFFERWRGEGGGAIDPEALPRARALAAAVADEHLARLRPRDRAVERVWLLGSPAGAGVLDRLLMLEADRQDRVIERLLEVRFDDEYRLDGGAGPRPVRVRGAADRIDLLEGGRLRVVDYKTGHAPDRARSLQLPIYGRCAEQLLAGRRDREWRLAEAGYVAFGEARPWASLEGRRDLAEALAEGQQRFLEAVEAIEGGQFPVRPADPWRCAFCEYPTVCRKDYVGDE